MPVILGRCGAACCARQQVAKNKQHVTKQNRKQVMRFMKLSKKT
jgi:hypothetical protein